MDYYVPIPSLKIASFKDVSANDLTTFMSNHLDLKLLVLEENPFGEVPGIIIRNLRVICFKQNFLGYISQFEGVNAYFCGPTGAYHIRKFVHGWLNGAYSDNLNLIHIEQEDGERFRPGLLENHRQNQWDLNRMPLEYQLDEALVFDCFFVGIFKDYKIFLM
ncbi:hypothetical protein L5515_010687 [Caenorhabditis briggsae]|uniref:Uncharacterized protein n=1 Tax=Caenorhabditis briggsae TaxID=6238 RepID=A0AAE9ACZ7_CAEBR|nr:hypothetical protein L3Y34_003531 [Caenorhabditis briggsae]UMM27365.1 hypothetical protein L5515_010687 [Caenorhabditis briggsae]